MKAENADQAKLLRRLRENAGPQVASPCPSGEEHGNLLRLSSGSLHCPHQDHSGRPASHPLGAAEPTQNVWTA